MTGYEAQLRLEQELSLCRTPEEGRLVFVRLAETDPEFKRALDELAAHQALTMWLP